MKYPSLQMPAMMPSVPTAEKMHKWEKSAFVNARKFMAELRKYRKTVVLKDNYLEWQKTEEEIKNMGKPRPQTVGQRFNSIFGGWWPDIDL